MRFRPYSSPEFPNDNHQLHQGACWVCLSPTGQPRAVMRAPQPEAPPALVQLTPLPPSVVEAPPESPPMSIPASIPLPPASVVQNLLQRSPDGMGFTIRIPDAQLFSEWERPARTDELHLTSAPGPLLSELIERVDSSSFPSWPEAPPAGTSGERDEAPAQTRRSLEADTSTTDEQLRSPTLEPGAASPVLEPDASVPPPVAELIDNLPAPSPMNTDQAQDDERALSAELFEVLKTLEIIDAETEFAPLDVPSSGVHPAPLKSAVDDLADAVAEALCAEFAGPAGDPLSAAHDIPGVTASSTPSSETVATADREAPARTEGLESVDTDSGKTPHTLDHYSEFLAALRDVAMASGATRAAAVLPRLMEGKLLDASALSDEVIGCLQQAGIAALRGSCIEPSEDFKANASAWALVLSGASEDLSACGDTLDGFAAGLLGALLGSRSDPKILRRELRRRGVAAFGMLTVAA